MRTRRVILGITLATAGVIASAVAAPDPAPTAATKPASEPAKPPARPAPPGAIGRPPEAGEWVRDSGEGQRALTPEELSEVVAVMKEYDPDVAMRLEEVRKANPERVRQMIAPHLPGLMRLIWLRRSNPELYQLRIQDFRINRESETLGRQLRDVGADPAKTDPLRTQLRAKLIDQFELRQKIRERELEQLEKRIAELRGEIRSRKAARDALIGQRIDQLTGKSVKVEW